MFTIDNFTFLGVRQLERGQTIITDFRVIITWLITFWSCGPIRKKQTNKKVQNYIVNI